MQRRGPGLSAKALPIFRDWVEEVGLGSKPIETKRLTIGEDWKIWKEIKEA